MSATDADKLRAIEECTEAEVKHMREIGRKANPEDIRREYVKLQEQKDRRDRK